MVENPTCPTAQAFMELGASVVREVAKMSSAAAGQQRTARVTYDAGQNLVIVRYVAVSRARVAMLKDRNP